MYSKEHLIYLRKKKQQRILIFIFQLLLGFLFIFCWQLLSNLNLINTFITSSPLNVLKTIINLHQTNNLYPHIWTTVYETILSFGLSTFLGLFIATIFWWYKFIAKLFDPYLTILNSLPKIALGPIIIIWIGAKTGSIIVMALLISVIITIINIYHSFKETNPQKIKLMKSFQATKQQIFFKLVLPSSLSNIMSTLKINISLSLIGVIMGEFLVSKKGIGYLIIYGSQVFNLNLVISGIVLLAIVSIFMYSLITYLEKKLTKNKAQ